MCSIHVSLYQTMSKYIQTFTYAISYITQTLLKSLAPTEPPTSEYWWKTLASEAIMRIPQLVPKDGAYEASLQPEGFFSRLPFWIFQRQDLCWMCWVPQTRDARGQKCSHLIKWQTSPKKQELLPERYSWKDGAIIMFFGCVFALRPRLTPN